MAEAQKLKEEIEKMKLFDFKEEKKKIRLWINKCQIV